MGEKGVSGAVNIAVFLCFYPISLAWTRLDRHVCGILEYVSRFIRNYSPRRNDHLLKQPTSGSGDSRHSVDNYLCRPFTSLREECVHFLLAVLPYYANTPWLCP